MTNLDARTCAFRTGWPAEQILSSTVIAPSAAEADALATALYVMSLEESAKLLQQRPDVSALLITHGKRAGEIELHPFNMSPFAPRKDASFD